MGKALQLSILPLKIRIGYVLMSAEVRTLVSSLQKKLKHFSGLKKSANGLGHA